MKGKVENATRTTAALACKPASCEMGRVFARCFESPGIDVSRCVGFVVFQLFEDRLEAPRR